ncbi:MAG: hypothetical protein M0R17_04140 [Candidatus Omnitrophica bacterium]|nr:hypothetical protein [Candidatus Omnitrophota bacterium]
MQFEKSILNEVLNKNGKLYRIGGCVRDAIIGIKCKDIDYLITGLDLNEIFEILSVYGKPNIVGQSFGIITVNIDHMQYDFAMPRIDTTTGFGHCDFEIKTDKNLSVTDDLSRREITINAIAYDVETGEYIDPFNGISDIKEGILKCVGDPDIRFNEDALRIMRVIQFSNRFGFEIERNTLIAILKNKKLLHKITGERIYEEIKKAILKSKIKRDTNHLEFLLNISGVGVELFGDEFTPISTNTIEGDELISTLVALFFYGGDYHALVMPSLPKSVIEICRKLKTMDPFDVMYKKRHLFQYVYDAMMSIGDSYWEKNIMKLHNVPLEPSELKIKGETLISLGYVGAAIGTIQKAMCRAIYDRELNNNATDLLRFAIANIN